MTTLTDTQLVMLSAAAQREDHGLVLPERLKGQAARKSVERLLRLGFIEEIAASGTLPVWRRDDEGSYALRITALGLSAIGNKPEGTEEGGEAAHEDRPGPAADGPANTPPLGAATPPRSGSKQALVVALLSREQGATLADLTTATGWLPHTARAALTGLRHKGYALTSHKDKGSPRLYHIGVSPSGSAGQAAE